MCDCSSIHLEKIFFLRSIEQRELLAFRAATPACVRWRPSLWGEGCRVAPVSDVQRRLQVQPPRHI